eukprot:771898-Amorphochlora_amoeboformis.AAC.1
MELVTTPTTNPAYTKQQPSPMRLRRLGKFELGTCVGFGLGLKIELGVGLLLGRVRYRLLEGFRGRKLGD